MTTLLLTIEEAAAQLRAGRDRIYELLRDGELDSVQLGPQSRRIRAEDLERYVKNLPSAPPPDGAGTP